jgi:exodeoxyribonuclease V beta subunit
MSTQVQLKNLEAATIPLTGRHLIEASAGTGKTYNITRIYLRLLLERELTVEEILLMTFTKDATQELRGRIDASIREALTNWQSLCETDSYFAQISKKVHPDKVKFLLKRALLFLDEAAIFTIHGFCQRALTQHAFASGLPFNANMSTNSNELILEACQDWYRQLAKQDSDSFALVEQFWATPSAFVSSFAKPISHRAELSVLDVQELVNKFVKLAKQANSAIATDLSLLNEGLVAHKKAEEQEKRAIELVKLQTWLTQLSECFNEQALLETIKQPMPDYLLNGNRHPKAFKVALAQVLDTSKKIKTDVKDLAKKINKAKAYQVVRSAIYQIRGQVLQSKEQLNVLDFDDLINTLADCLKNEEDNRLAKTLLAQYPVALVDEFQDTDPQQFSILQSIYYQTNFLQESVGNSHHQQIKSALYLIGDPKQAIYGFRGGDIFAYLSARSNCDYHWLMDTNWRSSPDMVNAYNQVFHGDGDNTVFGYGIPYQSVKAGKTVNQPPSSFHSQNNQCKALQFVHFSTEEKESKQAVRPLMATWCANEIVSLLTDEEVKPKDVAILVRDGREAADIKQALLAANLASVFLSDRANLFHSEQAMQLISVLKGILSPENERLYLNALACGLFGYDASALYQLQQDEMAYQTLKLSFFDYREQWQRQGFIAMAIHLMHQHFKISIENKDRALTNLLHLFEILQSASQKFLQPQELLYWFEQQCSIENSASNNDMEAEQRLESDGDLIRIVTQHGAKGLEYPTVFIPFATRHKDPLKFGNKSVSYIEYHNEQGQLCMSLDGDDQAKSAMANEAYAETIRLLYVAITRAENRCYIFTTPFDKYAFSPLGKTLQWQLEEDIVQHLQKLQAKSPQAIDVKQVSFDAINFDVYQQNNDHLVGIEKPEVSKFKGKIERDWWLSSFSALSRNLRHGGVSTPDRDTELLGNVVTSSLKQKKPRLRFELAKGAHSGNLLHDILEQTDFKMPDETRGHWLESIKWPLVKYGELTAGFNEDDLIFWLDEIITTPLVEPFTGSQLSHVNLSSDKDFCLADIAMDQTLRESEFYFPMEKANISALTKLLTDHRNLTKLDEDHSFNANPVRLPSYQSLKGMMHGFIDLVFEQNGKYYVCDYKSSHLGDDFTDYNPLALRTNIEKNYYDLQYLIYSLALHRYLKQNVTDYDVKQHFGGIYYLYLRGMTNDEKHRGAGVYFRNILLEELTTLDNIFLGKEKS